jgi:uncharacterized membrane protein
MRVPIFRAIAQGMVQVTVVLTFMFTAKSGVNGGIIATLFTTSLIFTILIFYLKYGQTITRRDIIGTVLIMVCIVLIAIGG